MVHHCEICPNNVTHIDRNGQSYITCMFYEGLLELIEAQGIDINTIECATGGIFEIPCDIYNLTEED